MHDTIPASNTSNTFDISLKKNQWNNVYMHTHKSNPLLHKITVKVFLYMIFCDYCDIVYRIHTVFLSSSTFQHILIHHNFHQLEETAAPVPSLIGDWPSSRPVRPPSSVGASFAARLSAGHRWCMAATCALYSRALRSAPVKCGQRAARRVRSTSGPSWRLRVISRRISSRSACDSKVTGSNGI